MTPADRTRDRLTRRALWAVTERMAAEGRTSDLAVVARMSDDELTVLATLELTRQGA